MISIIGAGPAGSYLAYLLASQGRDVHVYEEHSEIGRPVHCTGIVTSKFADIIEPDESFVANTIDKARLFSPDGHFIELQLGKNYVLDRAKLDLELAKGAEKADAEFHLSHKFIDYKDGKLTLESDGKIHRKETDILVGADGPLSPVAKSAGMFRNREFFQGIQARARLENDNVVEFFLRPGGFAWIVPESKEIVRIGAVDRDNPNPVFEKLLETRLGAGYKTEIMEYQGGMIPIHNPHVQTQKDNVFLVGDAATMVKPTTGGGIVQGLLGAEALADALINKGDYRELWREKIGRELKTALFMRRLMDEFSEQDYNLLIRGMGTRGMRHALEKYGRDTLSNLLPKLAFEAIKQPKFLYLARHLLKRNLYI
jgi:digeranylgeranylglycerophospholipid reductase